MNTKLYVGNMSFSTTEEELRALFSQAGTIQSLDIVKDRDTGQSRGFAFVEMSSQAEAEKAIQMFNRKLLGERDLNVNIAKPREERSGGGYRGGSNRRY